MTVDKLQLKKLIDQSTLSNLQVFPISSLEKHSLKLARNDLDRFINKTGEYVLIAIRK